MKVLFVSSGKNGGVSIVVKNQGDSLKDLGINIDYFTIEPGLWGYTKSILKLRKKFKSGNYNVVHAHYSFSGFVGSLAGCKPLVVSLMGSDVYQSWFWRAVTVFFSKNIWDKTIVKSDRMMGDLKINHAEVIPNGVNVERFKVIKKIIARKYLNIPEKSKLIISVFALERPEKNIKLAKSAVKMLNISDVMLKFVYNIPNEEMPFYYNAADVLLVTSKWEGSVNVVKEAMACNCPIVSTDVGDVRWVVGDTLGCYLTTFNPEDIAEKIKLALEFREKEELTGGRDRLLMLGLDSWTVGKKIKKIYESILFKE
ncbi:MAG TPA: glycosyltransferase [Victivallales bacterium]|nr:glycosyltransferase [Victivallales bacterium]